MWQRDTTAIEGMLINNIYRCFFRFEAWKHCIDVNTSIFSMQRIKIIISFFQL